MQLNIPYCISLIMVTITSHIFINIFQTVQFPAVKFTRSNEKNMSFLLINTKISKSMENLTQSDRDPSVFVASLGPVFPCGVCPCSLVTRHTENEPLSDSGRIYMLCPLCKTKVHCLFLCGASQGNRQPLDTGPSRQC